jgi:hypothetical protein
LSLGERSGSASQHFTPDGIGVEVA